MQSGFIKIYRKISHWEWYDDKNTFFIFFHILISANYKPKLWHGIEIKRGQLVTSIAELAKSTSTSIQQTRSSINKLKATNDITITSTNKFTVITLTNYELYNGHDFENNKQITNEITNQQQTNNKQNSTKITTTKEAKEVNKEKKEREEIYFLDFWNKFEVIVNNEGKSIEKGSETAAREEFFKIIGTYSIEVILCGLSAYLAEKKISGTFTHSAENFLKQKIFLRYAEKMEQEKKALENLLQKNREEEERENLRRKNEKTIFLQKFTGYKDFLKNEFGEEKFQKWLATLDFYDKKDSTIYMIVESKFLRDMISRDFLPEISSGFKKIDSTIHNIKIISKQV